MQAKTKKRIKLILRSQPTNKELYHYTGKSTSHIATLRANYVVGNASKFGIHVMQYKLDKVSNITKDKKILSIIDSYFTDEELSANSGLDKSVIYNLRDYDKTKEKSYGYEYHTLALRIEQIAQSIGA